MALKPCRECGGQVSTEAEVCPHCGVRSPTASKPVAALGPNDSEQNKNAKSRGLRAAGKLLLIVIGIVALATVLSKAPNNTAQAPSSLCQSDWTKCTDNEELVKNYSKWFDVRFDCKEQAKKQALYGTPVWPSRAFDYFLKGNEYVTSGMAVAIEPDAQFQNGFGAMAHSHVRCTYDLRAGRVTNVDILPR
jgi:RNA polymerase subunit RPABC4/transcription elongation factor Spt4